MLIWYETIAKVNVSKDVSLDVSKDVWYVKSCYLKNWVTKWFRKLRVTLFSIIIGILRNFNTVNMSVVNAQLLSCVQLFATPWAIVSQAPLAMGFSRQEYWSGLPCPPPGDLPDPGIKPSSPAFSALQEDSLPLSHLGSPPKCQLLIC